MSPDLSSFSPATQLQELSDTHYLVVRGWLSQWGVWLSAQSHLLVSSTEDTGSPGTVKLREEGSLRTLVGGGLTGLSVLLYFSLLSTVYNQMM